MPPPNSERRPSAGTGVQKVIAATEAHDTHAADIPVPTRPDLVPVFSDAAVEARFREDQRAWRRRIACARRTPPVGVDEVAPSGRWS